MPDGLTLSYDQLNDEFERVARLLAAVGVERGKPVSIVLKNGPEFLITFLAVARARAIAAPLNPAHTVNEFKFYMENVASQLAIMPPGDHPARDATKWLGIPTIDILLSRRQDTASSRGCYLRQE